MLVAAAIHIKPHARRGNQVNAIKRAAVTVQMIMAEKCRLYADLFPCIEFTAVIFRSAGAFPQRSIPDVFRIWQIPFQKVWPIARNSVFCAERHLQQHIINLWYRNVLKNIRNRRFIFTGKFFVLFQHPFVVMVPSPLSVVA